MRRNKKKEKFYLLLLILLGLTVGYSLLSTTLKIDGTAGVKSNSWGIYWDSDSVDVTEGSVESSDPTISESNTKVSFTTTLELPGDFYEFTIDAVNNGTVDGMISDIRQSIKIGTEEENLPEYIKFSVTYADGAPIQKYQYLKKRVDATHPTKETYKVRLEYLESATVLPSSDKTYTINYEVDYQQADDSAKVRPVCTNITSSESIFVFNASTNTITGINSEVEVPASITIPCTIDGVEVLNIGSSAFASKPITAVTFNGNLETIGSGAFSGTQVKKFDIPDSVKTINAGSLYSSAMEELIIGNGISTFDGTMIPSSLSALKKAVIGNGITTIPDGLFGHCTSLSDVTLGDNIETIGRGAFTGDPITEIKLPKKLKTISDQAFNITKLEKLVANEKLETIGFGAFQNCTDLTSVKLSDSVKTIQMGAFSGADIKSLVIPKNVETIASGAFKVSETSNSALTKIVNKSGRSFDWDSIINGKSTERYTFETGDIDTEISTTVSVTK